MKLKVRQPDINPRSCRVWLDDNEVTSGLTGLGIVFKRNEVTSTVLEIRVDALDIDADTLAVLQAHVDQDEAGDEEPKPAGVAAWR